MIRYSLACGQGHKFESWFRSSSDSDEQLASGLVECPHCGSSDVKKTLMAPAVSTRKGKAEAPLPVPVAPSPPVPMATPPKEVVEAVEKLRALRDKIVEKADYVGPQFAEEARKIHYEEAEERQIYGEATPEDVSELVDEGIAILPLPSLPQDQN
ncbi:MAG: DUF1178 family protein [Pseudomonadota bacterium]